MISSRATRRFISTSLSAAVLASGLGAGSTADASQPITIFESGQVRPLALSPDGKLLFAVNTPDNRLEVFKVKPNELVHRASVPVGLEPVAVAARSDDEVWVVNHLSDSVSVVRLDGGGSGGHVVRTLLVGDEPRDIVFAGPGRQRAFITTAHRGQNAPFDPQLTTPGVGRADVWVFDAGDLGALMLGHPLTILSLFTDTPRALAVTPDGSRVYAAGLLTGNRTTTIPNFIVSEHGGYPPPATNAEGEPIPPLGLIVKFDGSHWKDELGRNWDDYVMFSLPDKDVFVLDATANPPAQLPGPSGFYTGVGTVLYNMIVNPVSGKVYVSNTDARNEQRFEGPGIFAGHSIRGYFAQNRISVLGGGGAVTPRHLNKHINYASCCAPIPNAENEKSLALPVGMAITPDGGTLYVAAMGSDKIGIYATAALENNTFVPSTSTQIHVSGGGPTGLALDATKRRLYALTRFDNGISIINTQTRAEIAHVTMHNPEPPSITAGRRVLYDASLGSSHGDSACASCHVFGDLDNLAWDLGNPDEVSFPMPGPFVPGGQFDFFTGQPIVDPTFNPVKGPMTTQSLRGMANHGPMHWRGDRTGGNDAPSAQPDGGTFDERAAFKQFQGGFVDLLGRSGPIPDADMEAFTDFILKVTYPPNPIRNLDNSLTPAQQTGRDAFFNDTTSIFGTCEGCHALDPNANPGTDAPGFFGSNSLYTFDFVPQLHKVPHFRNIYQKIGMFGMADNPFFLGGGVPMGDQIRGFGFVNEGQIPTIFQFVSNTAFDGIPFTPEGDETRRGIEAFLFAFDSNMAPIVGQQVTLNRYNGALVGPRIDLLRARAAAGECDLVAKTRDGDSEAGFLYIGDGSFLTDRQGTPHFSDAGLRSFAVTCQREVTYTCTPPGSGVRIGIDRDSDGFLDGDEQIAGSDPADPSSTP